MEIGEILEGQDMTINTKNPVIAVVSENMTVGMMVRTIETRNLAIEAKNRIIAVTLEIETAGVILTNTEAKTLAAEKIVKIRFLHRKSMLPGQNRQKLVKTVIIQIIAQTHRHHRTMLHS